MTEIIECDCPCHSPTSDFVAMHCVPCCRKCDKCGKNFSEGFDEHVATCWVNTTPPEQKIIDDHRQNIIKCLTEKGCFYREVDGFMVFQHGGAGGFYDAYSLRVIADHLDEQNAEWAAQIDKDLAEANRGIRSGSYCYSLTNENDLKDTKCEDGT